MSYSVITVLSDSLKASSQGNASERAYRAMLVRHDETGKYAVMIQQGFADDSWNTCGVWNLSTLLFGWPANIDNRPGDGLSLDFGQQWQIDSGMREALAKAVELI